MLEKQPEKAKTLFEELGGMEGMKEIVQIIMRKVYSDPQLGHFFVYTDEKLHMMRLTHYFACLTGASIDYIGSPVDQAHQGRFITKEHLDLFLDFATIAMEECKIKDTFIKQFLQLLQNE